MRTLLVGAAVALAGWWVSRKTLAELRAADDANGELL